MRAIEKLSNDPHNVVVVITGLTKQKLGNILSVFVFLQFLICHICANLTTAGSTVESN